MNEIYDVNSARLLLGALLINPQIINDDKYGDFAINKIFSAKYNYKYQFLHSHKIKFKEMPGKLKYLSNKEFVAPLKQKQKEILKNIFKEEKINEL